ncbi:MAG TPA: CBS domain-containing protein [Anaeromyxobacter sp.]|nr:CBS domain-containing protein [Anaeromyxobacter sp.]
MLVATAMTRGAEAIGPNESLAQAARRMRDLGVGALAVCEDGRVVGLITDRDVVVRAVAAGCEPEGTSVASAMTAQVVSCREDEELADAATRMELAAVRRLVVLDAAGRLAGLLSIDDVALQSPTLAGEILEHSRAPERPVHRGPWPWWEEPVH